MPIERMGDFFNKRIEGFERKMLENADAEYFYSTTGALLPKNKGARILDLGCGTGLELDFYFKNAPDSDVEITCIDLAEDLLKMLRKKHAGRNIKLINDSYFSVDFGESTYDAVVAVETLHHFKRDMKTALYRKIRSALVPGGVYVETDYVAADDEMEKAKFEEAARRRAEENIPDDVFVHLDTPHTKEHLIEMMKEAGFDTVELVYYGSVAIIRCGKAE